jgi:hypothetical protein
MPKAAADFSEGITLNIESAFQRFVLHQSYYRNENAKMFVPSLGTECKYHLYCERKQVRASLLGVW